MGLYTFVMDYAGGTYVGQVEAADLVEAKAKWAREIDLSLVAGLDESDRAELVSEVDADSPAVLTGLRNAWCITASLSNGLALIHAIRTASPE